MEAKRAIINKAENRENPMTNHFDVIVLGSGNAGMAAAGVARAAGLEVAMIENREVGGTCPIRGCVPKKVLVAAAQVLDQIERAAVHHIEVDTPKLDWAALIEREQGFVRDVPAEFKDSLESRGIVLIEGQARFSGPNEVRVGETSYAADKIVIATGSVPRELPIAGWEHTITSDDRFASSGTAKKRGDRRSSGLPALPAAIQGSIRRKYLAGPTGNRSQRP